MANLDYKERLALLDAGTLELRRLMLDLITVYKIMFGVIDNSMIISRLNKVELLALVLVITIVLLK